MRARFSLALVAASLLAMLVPSIADAQSAPSDFTTATRYDASRRVAGTIAPDPGGTGTVKYLATRTTYDAAGRAIRVEKGGLSSWQPENILPSAWPAWNGTAGFKIFSKVETSYDALDRKTIEAAWGWDESLAIPAWVETGVTQYSYDLDGQLECTAVRMNPATWSALPASACTLATTSATYGPDRITKNVYDAAGQLLKVVKAYGQTTANGLEPLQQDYATYTYTDNGKQQTVKDADGNLAGYTYDGFDRLIAWRFPSKTATGTIANCTIAPIAETTDGFGNAVAGPSETLTSGGDCEKYAYDRNGNRAKLIKRDGNVIRYAFDALNRNTIKDIPGGTAADVYSGYDLRGLQTFARFVSTSGVGITNSFDGFGRLAGTTNNMGAIARALTYEYDADGNRTKLTYPDASYFTYVNDGLDRLSTIKEGGTTAIVSSTFDERGQLTSQTRGGVTTTLNYDGVSRPREWKDDLAETAAPTSDVTSTFAYNPASQIVTKGRTNNAYAWTGYTSLSRAYVVNGLNQYTTATPSGLPPVNFGYDANANLTGDGSNIYVYDVENRMISATIGTTANTLKYDPLGRLWQVVTPSKTLEFTYDGDAMVMEMNGTNPFRFVHGPGEDDPMIYYTGTGYGTRFSLQADYQGSIVSTADASGTKIAINAYDEYGITLASNVGRFQYTGQMWLSQLGLYYYKARMYSPTLGRFMQTDPIGYKDQVNLYAYVANDPLNRKDPTGEEAASVTCSNDACGQRAFSLTWDVAANMLDAATNVAVAIETIATLGGSAAGPDEAEIVGERAISGAMRRVGPGPYARESIPAGPRPRPDSKQQGEINRIGRENGCHTCGTKNPGTKKGNYIGDHQPPTKLNPPGGPQRYYPQCQKCSNIQGGRIRAMPPPAPPSPQAPKPWWKFW